MHHEQLVRYSTLIQQQAIQECLLNQEMFGSLYCYNLAKHNMFWTQSVDATNRQSISLYIKFLTAMKLSCSGVSFLAFQYCFQMDESMARLCASNLAKGIVECPDIADIYLHIPSWHNARHIVMIHKKNMR